MGKHDVMLDNGKKAESSMTRFWKQQKQRERNRHNNPNQQPIPNQEKQEAVPEVSSYDKWKQHQSNLILKKYNKGHAQQQRQSDSTVEKQPQKEEQPEDQSVEPKEKEEHYDTIIKKIQNRNMVIPGYGKNYSMVQKKMQSVLTGTAAQAPPPPTSKSSVPEGLKDLFQSPEDLQRILNLNKHKKKAKLQMKERQKARESMQQQLDPFHRTYHDANYDPTARPEQEAEQQPIKPQSTFVPPPPKQFKSDLLNRVAEGKALTEAAEVDKKEVQTKIQAKTITISKPVSLVPRSLLLKKA